MKLKEAIAEVRHRLGLLSIFNKSDVEWIARKIVAENQEVFDRLGNER